MNELINVQCSRVAVCRPIDLFAIKKISQIDSIDLSYRV